MAFQKKIGWQSSPATPLQKAAYGLGGGDQATVTITIIDDSHFNKSETQAQVRRGELARRLLSAMTGGPGYAVVKSRDAALADTGRVRRAVWEKLFPDEKVVTGTTMKKSEEQKPSSSDVLKKAAQDLDALVEHYREEK